jgi:hypothetical protein
MMRAAQMKPGQRVAGQRFLVGISGGFCLLCRGCNKAKGAKLVKGKCSEKHVCAAKCMSSHGTICECSCAGKNHGAAYEQA